MRSIGSKYKTKILLHALVNMMLEAKSITNTEPE